MDTDEKQKKEDELLSRFALLPDEIKNVISSSDYQMKLFDLAKKYKMTYEQLGALEMETTLVLLGVSDPKDYPGKVAAATNKKAEDLAPVIAEIKQQVFDPIHASLMALYPEPSDEDTESDLTSPQEQAAQKDTFAKSGISINTSSAPQTAQAPMENRADMLKELENPAKSIPTVLNEMPKTSGGAMPVPKAPGLNIPVPMAPYAGGAPSADMVKKEIPMTATPTGDITAGKLGGTFSMPAKQTDYSLKPAAPAPSANAPKPPVSKPGQDAYREPIE